MQTMRGWCRHLSWAYQDDGRYICRMSGIRTDSVGEKDRGHAPRVPSQHGVEDKFDDWGGKGYNIFVPVLGGNGTKIAPTADIFDQPPGQM